VGNGLVLLKKACRSKWEGLIVKRKDSPYVGKRSRDWLKFKCTVGQELIIVGYTPPKGSRKHFGALLVGYYKDKDLIYAGKVGTGFDQKTLALLGKKLEHLRISTCPLSDYENKREKINWVRPVLVAEFEFAQWTQASKLRVGRYKGLRDDKKAKDVIKERPKVVKIAPKK
jgi:bifunctional non-homologous end joining protein LigD